MLPAEELQPEQFVEEGADVAETHAMSVEEDNLADVAEVEPSEAMIAEGYDEAVESGVPYSAESEIRAWDSADPVAVSEAEPIAPDEIVLQEPGRDLRPDTITPSPDITSTGVAALDNINEIADELSDESLEADAASEAQTDEAETTTLAESEYAASGESSDEEKQ